MAWVRFDEPPDSLSSFVIIHLPKFLAFEQTP